MVTAAERLKKINELAQTLKKQASTADLDSFSKEELGSLTKSVQEAESGVRQATDRVKARVSRGETRESIRNIDDGKSLVQKAATKAKNLPETPRPTFNLPTNNDTTGGRISNTVALSSALNKAVQVARKQRQSAELDFIGGQFEPGAISAGTFGSLMSSLNRASTQFTQPLVSETLAAVEADREAIEQEKNDIRDLALSLVENGASQEAVQGVLNSPDINSAISASAGIMQSVTKDDQVVEKVGSNLVSYNPEDPQGTMKVLYSAGGSTGSSGGGSTSNFDVRATGSDIDYLSEKSSEVKSQVKRKFSQEFANKIITELTDEQLRLFMNDFIAEENSKGQSLNPVDYYEEWRNALDLGGSETTTSATNPFR